MFTAPWLPDEDEDEYRPGGPLCACEVCDVLRDRYGVEELTPEMIAESNALQAVGARTAADLDRLPPTVVPAVDDELGGWPVATPALRPGLL